MICFTPGRAPALSLGGLAAAAASTAAMRSRAACRASDDAGLRAECRRAVGASWRGQQQRAAAKAGRGDAARRSSGGIPRVVVKAPAWRGVAATQKRV